MTTLYLVRHAQAEGNLYRRFHGQFDGQLTAQGRRQLVPLALRFADVPLAAVYSSDRTRARKTAEAIAAPHRLPVQLDVRLREIAAGVWEDRPVGEVERLYADEYAKLKRNAPELAIPGGETWEQFTSRFLSALEDCAAVHDGQEIALVTHGMVLNAALKRLFPIPDGYCDNTAVTCLTWDGAKFAPVFWSDASHLTPELSTYASQRAFREHPEAHYQFWFQSALHEPEWYIRFRREAWELVYGDLKGFDGADFWATAVRDAEDDPAAIVFPMSDNRIAGILQLNVNGYASSNAGYIPFIYLREEYRHKGLGVQLIGYAVQYFRKLGRTRLQLSVAPENAPAIRFYEKLEFRRIAVTGGRYKLWLMEKDI